MVDFNKYFGIYVENMKARAISETNIAKDAAIRYSKYYASIAFDQVKIYFDLGENRGLSIVRVTLIKRGLIDEIEITSVPADIILFVDDLVKYNNPRESLKELVSNVKYNYDSSVHTIDLRKNTNDGLAWTLYAKYKIRNTYYMVCFYDLNVLRRRPNAEIYEELISAEIIDERNSFVLDVTPLFKMYEGPNFDFNSNISDIRVLDILLTPNKFYTLVQPVETFIRCKLKIEYSNSIDKILKFDDLMFDNLVLSKVAVNVDNV